MNANRKIVRYAGLGIIGLLIGVSALMAAPMASAAYNKFVLSDSGTSPVFIMFNNGASVSGSVSETNTHVWIANAAAPAGGISFSGKTFTLSIDVGDGNSLSGSFYVGSATSGGGFISFFNSIESTALFSNMAETGAGTGIFQGSVTISSTQRNTVPEGDYLALIHYSNSGTVYMNADSTYLQFTGSEPDYPVPELSTIILMTSGLIVGVGMLAYSNRKKE